MRKRRNYDVCVLVLWPCRGCCSLKQHVHNNAGAAHELAHEGNKEDNQYALRVLHRMSFFLAHLMS
jgi:hypothetical protein